MVQVTIERFIEGRESTIGKLKIIDNGRTIFECYTLENLREGLTPGNDLRVPPDEYNLYWRNSPSKGDKIHLYNNKVPKERYIMFHSGNVEKDTLGCILLGRNYRTDAISNSRETVAEFERILKQYRLDDVRLSITNNIRR